MDSQTATLFGLQSSTMAQTVLRKYYKDAGDIFRSCLMQRLINWSTAGIREHTLLYSFVSIQKYKHTRDPESQVISDRGLYVLEIQPSTSAELGSVLDEIYGKAID